MNFKEELEQKTEQMEAILKQYLPREEGYAKTVIEAMNYSILAGGKRLRPMLMWETAVLFGDAGELVKPFMAALEMIHNYSLVHDDLPAMDWESNAGTCRESRYLRNDWRTVCGSECGEKRGRDFRRNASVHP